MSEVPICPAHFGCVLGSGHEGGCSPFFPGELEAMGRLATASTGALRSLVSAWAKFAGEMRKARARERR